MRQIVLDTETTGLSTKDGHRIIEFGGIELINRRYTGNRCHYYLNPERTIEAEALAVHGITPEFLADKPVFKKIAAELLSFLQGAELIIHNAAFDVEFLDCEFKLIDQSFNSIKSHCEITDTLLLARQKHPGQQNSLDALCKRYQVDNSTREFHGALLDAKLLAEVYLAMTGGQTSLFVDNLITITTTNALPTKSVIIDRKLPLPIIFATAEEQQLHQQRLQTIQKASGKCLWLEEKEEA